MAISHFSHIFFTPRAPQLLSSLVQWRETSKSSRFTSRKKIVLSRHRVWVSQAFPHKNKTHIKTTAEGYMEWRWKFVFCFIKFLSSLAFENQSKLALVQWILNILLFFFQLVSSTPTWWWWCYEREGIEFDQFPFFASHNDFIFSCLVCKRARRSFFCRYFENRVSWNVFLVAFNHHHTIHSIPHWEHSQQTETRSQRILIKICIFFSLYLCYVSHSRMVYIWSATQLITMHRINFHEWQQNGFSRWLGTLRRSRLSRLLTRSSLLGIHDW